MSIITAALAFASQNLLNNIISGITLSVTKVFAIGDRIRLVNSNILGFVESINFRYTVIKTVNNNRFLIPNSMIANEILENSNYTENYVNNFVDLSITFDSDIQKAKTIITNIVTSNSLFLDFRSQEEKDNNVPIVNILTRDISNFRIELRITVWAYTTNENFILCSEIREKIVEAFLIDPDINLYQQEVIIKK